MLLLFILTFLITAEATEDTKYIDLLPQKEKELFLDKVARRILEEVDSKPSKQKSGGEVPEEELDVHAEFVKKILREEEANLRKQNHNDNVDLSVKPLDKERKTIDLTLRSRIRRNNDKIKNFDPDSDSRINDEKTQFINEPGSKSDEKDIQIKDFKIKSKDDLKAEPEANNDDVQTISTDKVTVETETPTIEQQDNVEKVRNYTFNFSDADESKINTTSSKAEENKSFLQSNISENINDENQKGNKPILRDNISTEKHDENKTTFLDIPVQILRDGDSVKNIKETSSKEGTVPTEEVPYTTTQKQVDNVETAQKVETSTKTNVSELRAKENIKRDINAVTDTIESDKEINNSKTEELPVKNFRINTTNFGESKIDSTDINNTNSSLFIDLETTTQSTVKVDSKTMRVDSSIKKHKNVKTFKSDLGISKIKDDSVKPNVYRKKKIHQRDTENMKPVTKQKFEVTTQKIEILTPLIPLTSKYSTKNNKNKEKHSKEVDSKIIQVLRDVVDRTKVNANGKFDGLKSIYKMKEHKVYEIPISDKTIIIDDSINKEQPYYYPIYNYAPKNAYYNAHNNFGPNQDDLGLQNDKNLEQNQQGKGNYQTDFFFDDDDDDNNKKIRFGYPDGAEHTKDFKLNPIAIKYPNKLNTNYDDPAIGRNKHTKSKNKDKNEEPKLKSSLREIRMMMYATKMFGYVPDKTYSTVEVDSSNSSEESTEKSNLRVNFEAILDREHKERDRRIIDDESNIAVDYYFGRMNHNAKADENNEIPVVEDVVQRFLDKNNYKIYVLDPTHLKPKTNAKYIARNEEKKPNFEKIQQILNIANDVDMIPTLNTLLKMNITRSGAEERDLEIYVDVLADLIQTDNTALVQYDWLGTTVNIQGATLKLLELTQLVLFNKYINPTDLELLKYTIYLYKKASVMNQYHEELRMKLPRGKHMKKRLLTTKGLIDRVWLYRQSADTDEKIYYKLTKKDLKIFGEFLNELLNSLYEIHTAIKEIASITKYNQQNWFKNLKDLYLKRSRTTSLELLLHLTANRVLDLVENSARNGLDNDYLSYIQKNGKEVKRTENELVFLLKILNEIEIMNE